MRSGVLISILILALTGYGLFQLYSSKKEAIFQANLIEVDTSAVTSILLSNHPNSSSELSFLKETREWIISNDQIHIKANPLIIQELFRLIAIVKTDEVVTKERKSWKIYGVDEVQGTRVRLYDEKKLLEDFVIGKSDVNPQTQAPISYVRLYGEDEVYVVNGNMALVFSQNFTDSRSRLILQIDPSSEITELAYQVLDTSWRLMQRPEGWKLDSFLLDSIKITRYLRQLQNISGDIFADHFDEVQGSKYLYQTLTIQCKNLEEPFVITCYRDTTLKLPFIIHSSQNQEAFFASDSSGIYNIIFHNVNDFLKKEKRDVTSSR